MPDVPYTLASGDLAFWDTFSGLVPCRVLSIAGTEGDPSTGQKFKIKLTAERGPYKAGEEIDTLGTSVVHRKGVYVRNGQYRVLINWSVKPDVR
ncbi:hypothetical protein [Micromonospora maritima]|uniref:hypothetical protein n=1 Tax=Micromonospora maritima TaxID=986711 RepID=UPI00157C1EB0|nr:hypothetical protein [Micromonospora maritima]